MTFNNRSNKLIMLGCIFIFIVMLFFTSAASANNYQKKVWKPAKPESKQITEESKNIESKKQNPQAEKKYRKRVTWLFPKRNIRKRVRFRPWDNPTKKQSLKIMEIEQNIWGGPSLYNRIYCESKFKPKWVVGRYSGLLMIDSSWWEYVWPKTPKRIVYKTTSRKKLPIYKITLWSDGKRVKKIIDRKAVSIKRINIGHLPKRASTTHGWAAIRVGQRAVSGGPPATWSCSL